MAAVASINGLSLASLKTYSGLAAASLKTWNGLDATTSSWIPTDVAGLQLWLKADSLALNDGDRIATWADQSGMGNNATASSGDQPTYKTSVINSKPVARFAVSGTEGMHGSIVLTSTTCTAFAVCTITSSSQNYARILSLSNTTSLDYNSAARAAAILRIGTNATVGAYRNNAENSKGTISYGTFFVVVSVYDGTNNTVYINGTAQTAVGSTGTFNVADYGLGRESTSLASLLDGDIAECGCYNSALGTTDRGNLTTYLKNKYGL